MPSILGHDCAQVCPRCSQGSARDTIQIALRSAYCQSPFRGLSSRHGKIKQSGRERNWGGLLKMLILRQLVGMFSPSRSLVFEHWWLAVAEFPSQLRRSEERAADAFPEAA